MLYTINLAGPAELIEAPVSDAFGRTDMYRDFADATNQHSLEQQLSGLESSAAKIIAKIRMEHEAGKGEVWLPRAEKDTLRKFLFIMKYRSSGFHRRFYHDTAAAYSEDDTEAVLEYMRKKGYKKPIDIWFHNIKTLLEMKMDLKGNWAAELRESMYPNDAEWAIVHIQMMYLALCKPSDQGDEFLITENTYSIHEGPVSSQVDPVTGESTDTCYTEYHVFGVISPTLVMVLRSSLLPIPEEDTNDKVRKSRESMYELSRKQHNDPSKATSVLEDLPISKAHPSYIRVVNGSRILAKGEDGSPRPYHKFCFRFFPISTEHVNKINCVMLEQSHSISTIAFKSRIAARKTLEYYLSRSCEPPNQHNFKFLKTVGDQPDDKRLICLKKLEQAARQLGSAGVYRFQGLELQVQGLELQEDEKFAMLGQMLQEHSPKEPTDFMKSYMNLGGSALGFPKDMDQAKKMLNMRIKVDVWSRGVDELVRERIRKHVQELFCELPPRRVFFYLKSIRHMILEGVERAETIGSKKPDTEAPETEPEDAIANASQLFRDKDLCRLMHFATLNHIDLTKLDHVDNEFRRLAIINSITFGRAGSICDCGIAIIEEKARASWKMFQATQVPIEYHVPFRTEAQNLEMATRMFVRDHYYRKLFPAGENALSEAQVAALEDVLFNVVYLSNSVG